nr:pre-toxin TG domain-containing protein [Priestia megaterium]
MARSVYEEEAKKQQQDGLAAVSFVADMVPVVSNVKGGWEASVGYDPITGNELSSFDRSVSGAGIVFGGFARVSRKVVKYGSEGAEYVLRVNKAEKTVTKHKVKDVSKGESKAVEKVEERGKAKEPDSSIGDKDTGELSEIVKQSQKIPKHINVKNKTNLPGKGEPNSSADLLNPDGTVKQRRYYDESGRAKEDIDFNHSDDGTHTFPHRHKWDWSKKPPRQKQE